ncbi:MAG: hypothetical protein JXN60_01910, partial [Lentisphaerae bacterium]|nr:hypothetical protein [Lentisphaerota bacterium]
DPKYIWTPALCPEPGDVVGDHAFRAPLLAAHGVDCAVGLIPDLDVLGKQRFSEVGRDDWRYAETEQPQGVQIKAFMSAQITDEGDRDIRVGFADYECRPHVYYRLTGAPVAFPAGSCLEIGYWLFPLTDGTKNPFDIRRYLSFLWKQYGRRYVSLALPQKLPFGAYSRISYRSALACGDVPDFKRLDGAPAAGVRNNSSRLAVDIAHSHFKIPSRVVWFSAWFNSLRTAFGMRYHGWKMGGGDGETLVRKAGYIKDLILSAPDIAGGGMIPQFYDYERREWWNASPRLAPGGRYSFDVTATAHTAQCMALWHRHIEQDPRLLNRSQRIAEFMLSLQESNGAFPGYLDRTGKPMPYLRNSGQSGMVSLFLCELYEEERDPRLLEAIEKACRFYIEDLIPDGRYHDFETFFSCSEKPLNFFDRRTGQNAQNNLALAWVAETLLRAHVYTGQEEYREWGRRCLDGLSLYQQVWNPPFLRLYAFGGFGSMNTDGEWNDMRQAWFSHIYLRAYLMTGEPEYFERGVAALRAGYALYCHPLHDSVNPLGYDKFADGLMPENYAHTCGEGHIHRSGFCWGGGLLATSTALSELLYGGLFVHMDYCHAFGIDGCTVVKADFTESGISLTVIEQTGKDRFIDAVIYSEGIKRVAQIKLTGNSETICSWTRDALMALPVRKIQI